MLSKVFGIHQASVAALEIRKDESISAMPRWRGTLFGRVPPESNKHELQKELSNLREWDQQ